MSNPLAKFLLVLPLALATCRPATRETAQDPAPRETEGVLARVGSLVVTRADLDLQLKEKHGGRQDEATRREALDELAAQARMAQAALDAGLAEDPLARAEIARVLSARLREKELLPRLQEAAGPVPETRLRELYQAQAERFQATEKRQVAVLWLNPGGDSARQAQYEAKMKQAREWLSNDTDLASHPDKGFSVLAVDYSEHAPTRFAGGVLGWLDAGAGATAWHRAVAQIAFSLKQVGEVSPVVARPEGIFLVRWMAHRPATRETFESVRPLLEREEQNRLRQQLETEFERAIEDRYPVQPGSPGPGTP